LGEYQKAPEVTRERMYIESLESVLGKTSKVLVDVEKGSNLLYLPLDKLTQRSSSGDQSSSTKQSSSQNSGSSSSTPLTAQEDVRQRASSSRTIRPTRETR